MIVFLYPRIITFIITVIIIIIIIVNSVIISLMDIIIIIIYTSNKTLSHCKRGFPSRSSNDYDLILLSLNKDPIFQEQHQPGADGPKGRP